VKRLVCLVYTMGIVACAFPVPDMPAYAGERNGVEYYIEHESGFTLDRATEIIEVAVAAWGMSMDDVRGLKVGFYAKPMECGDMGKKDGCYYSNGDLHIIQLARGKNCLFYTPVAHELWHYFWSPGEEPGPEAFAQIFATDEIVYSHFARIPGGCYR
jgi:hypothetical protein